MLTWLKNRLQRSGLTAYITHPDCLQHNMGVGHPECLERLIAIRDQLMASQILDGLQEIEAPEVTEQQLARVHPPHYLEYLEACSPSIGTFRVDPDTAMSAGTLQAARRRRRRGQGGGTGGRGQGAQRLLRGSPARPSRRERQGDGLLLFNNLAIGVTHALAHYQFERVAVIDFDVHHGNGTEEILRDDPRVLMVSIFQHPFYPYCGDEPQGPNMHNVPLKAGSGGREFREAVETVYAAAARLQTANPVHLRRLRRAPRGRYGFIGPGGS